MVKQLGHDQVVFEVALLLFTLAKSQADVHVITSVSSSRPYTPARATKSSGLWSKVARV